MYVDSLWFDKDELSSNKEYTVRDFIYLRDEFKMKFIFRFIFKYEMKSFILRIFINKFIFYFLKILFKKKPLTFSLNHLTYLLDYLNYIISNYSYLSKIQDTNRIRIFSLVVSDIFMLYLLDFFKIEKSLEMNLNICDQRKLKGIEAESFFILDKVKANLILLVNQIDGKDFSFLTRFYLRILISLVC